MFATTYGEIGAVCTNLANELGLVGEGEIGGWICVPFYGNIVNKLFISMHAQLSLL